MSKTNNLVQKINSEFESSTYSPSLSDLFDFATEMEEAMAEFIKRVEAGEVRSRKTYAKFKNILDRQST